MQTRLGRPVEMHLAENSRGVAGLAELPSGSLQDNSEFLGKPFLRNALQVIPGMT
jgi:hypothetical protein